MKQNIAAKNKDFEESFYRDYFKFTYCLDIFSQSHSKDCGSRNLYEQLELDGTEIEKSVSRRNIEHGTNSGCVWKLFSDDPNSQKQSLKYDIYFKEQLSENVNLFIYDLNMN